VIGVAVGVLLLSCLSGGAGADVGDSLPSQVREAIARQFPGARIGSIGRERERGVLFYEVDLRVGARELELEITPEGLLVEVAEELEFGAVPAEVAARILQAAAGGRILEVERIEVYALAVGGAMTPLPEKRVVYEFEYVDGASRRNVEARLDAGGAVSLKEAAGGEDDGDDGEDDGKGGGDSSGERFPGVGMPAVRAAP